MVLQPVTEIQQALEQTLTGFQWLGCWNAPEKFATYVGKKHREKGGGTGKKGDIWVYQISF